MYKTVFAIRVDEDRGLYIDSELTALWPPSDTQEFIEATLALRGEVLADDSFFDSMARAGFPDVEKLCRAMRPLQMRARYNMLRLYVVNADHKPTDEELLNHATNQRDARRRRAADAEVPFLV